MTRSITTASPRSRKAVGLLIAAGLMVFGAGCGSDSDDDSSAASEDSQSQSENESEDAEQEDAEQEDAESGGGDGDYCALLADMGSDALNGSAMTDPDAATDLVGTFREIAEVAPDDIAADWTTLADAMDTMANIDYSDPNAAAELEELGDLTAVSQRIQDSVQSECA